MYCYFMLSNPPNLIKSYIMSNSFYHHNEFKYLNVRLKKKHLSGKNLGKGRLVFCCGFSDKILWLWVFVSINPKQNGFFSRGVKSLDFQLNSLWLKTEILPSNNKFIGDFSLNILKLVQLPQRDMFSNEVWHVIYDCAKFQILKLSEWAVIWFHQKVNSTYHNFT